MPSDQPTILVVDDEVLILEVLQDLLEDDFRVLTATSGTDGLKLLEEFEVAVVLSDQRMPHMKGEEFLSRVAERWIATRILLTGYTDFEDLVQAVNRGHIYSFVPKPWSSPQLRNLVKTAAERYQLQRGLIQEKSLLDVLMEHTPDLISIKDLDGRYLRLNRAYAKALGTESPEMVLGKTDFDWGRPLLEEGLSREKAVLESRIPELDVTEKAASTSRWYSTTRVVTPESSAGSSFLVEISRDITERLETSRRLEEHSARLEAMNEELSRVSYIVAHHLQEPLRLIGSFVNLLERKSLLKQGAQEYIGYVEQGVYKAKTLMRDFSTYLELFKPVGKDLTSLAKSAKQASLLLSSNYPQAYISIQGEALIRGNPELMIRLFRSLMENSIIHAEVDYPIDVRIESANGVAKITVDDTGPGIPEEDRKLVFSLFETRTASTRSGLGLALCQRIAEQHDGRVWLESSPAGGLRVCVELAEHALSESESAFEYRSLECLQDLESRDRQLQELETRLSRVKSFAAAAAHDLHEPLRMVSGYLSLLERREGTALTSDGKEYLGFALKAAERMRALIDGLLVYSVSGRPARGEFRQLAEVMEDVRSDLHLAISESEATLHLDPSTRSVKIWNLEGRQLLSNLIGNSLKYRTERKPEVEIRAEIQGNAFLVSIEDNGRGVPEDLRETIFEPFVRGDHEELLRGTGLGLATCARIVGGWEGRIWCEARQDGSGSRFLFTIPQTSRDEPQTEH